MRYRELGKTGIIVSEIGFGAWGIGGETLGATSYGAIKSGVALNAIETAVSLGINFFDTSNIYGGGQSERLLGQALRTIRSDVVISSKMGMVNFEHRLKMTREQMVRSLDQSLERLQTDYLDILHLHLVPVEELVQNPEIIQTLQSFQAEGKVKCLAISLNDPNDALCSVVYENFGVIQVNFSLLDMRLLSNGFMSSSASGKLGVIARTPFNFGFLARNYPIDVKFGETDHRSRWSQKQLMKWIKGANQVLTALGIDNLNDSEQRVHFALKFCLHYSNISTVVPGMLSADEVRINVRAFEGDRLGEREIEAAIEIYEKWDKDPIHRPQI